MELAQARQEIDRVDEQITALFCRRMRLAAEIAATKRRNNLPLVNEAREQEILSRVGQQAGAELEAYTYALFDTLFQLSKEYQQQLMRADKPEGRG